MNNERQDVYTRISDKIVADLEQGVRTGMKPWIAGRPYRLRPHRRQGLFVARRRQARATAALRGSRRAPGTSFLPRLRSDRREPSRYQFVASDDSAPNYSALSHSDNMDFLPFHSLPAVLKSARISVAFIYSPEVVAKSPPLCCFSNAFTMQSDK
jgi:hypothetical protein